MAGKLSELTDQELLVVQRIGIEADNFLRNADLYVKHLKPALDAERERAKTDGDWVPGRETQLETLALYNSFNSGKRVGLRMIETVIAKIINRGKDAGEEYERRRKKEKK